MQNTCNDGYIKKCGAKAQLSNIEGIIFDMDGVLVDSERALTLCIIDILKDEYGINAKESDFLDFVGMGEEKYIRGVVEKYGKVYHPNVKELTYVRYNALTDKEIKCFPSVKPTVSALFAANKKLAVCSSADLQKINKNLDVAGLDKTMFSAIVSGDRVTKNKPDPEIYLLGAKLCGVRPERCIAVEDALAGIVSANSAGCFCVGITTSFSAEKLVEAGADCVIDDISELVKIVGIRE